MIKIFFLFFAHIYAGNFTISHPCEKKFILQSKFEIDQNQQFFVFDITKEVISKYSIPASLADNGVKTILNYIAGDDALEIISDSKMRAYGWCYSVNNFSPDVMPDEFLIKQHDNIHWFLSYSTYDSGNWIDYCKPVHLNPEAQKHICKDN